MRIGIDLLAIQAPSCRGRGIGRYAEALIRALLVAAEGREFVFYRRDDLGLDWEQRAGEAAPEWFSVGPDPFDEPDGTLQQIVARNPHDLDWLFIPNPVVERRGFALPEPVPGGPRLAAVVHDFIPALFPEGYLREEKLALEYANDLRRLRSYDLLLANSEATRRDAIDLLGVPDRRTATILAGADRGFFRPAGPGEGDDDSARLAALGIDRPFFYYLGNVDPRKNVLGLVDAYALLPRETREQRPLILTFGGNDWFRRVLAEKVEALGLGRSVIATGPIADETVRALCRRCEAFLSPSLYEGFGLPILEAMSCGSAVVAADNSSQPEVLGSAGILAPTGDAMAWAAILGDLARDPGRLVPMRAASLEQAARFTWEDSARKLRFAIESAPRRSRLPSRLAIVAHPAAGSSGYHPEAVRTFERLRDEPGAVVFLDADRAAALPPLPLRGGWHDLHVIGRVRSALGLNDAIHLVDTPGDLGGLVEALAVAPGRVIFANPSWSDSRTEEALRTVMRLATAVECRSEALARLLESVAVVETAGKIRGRVGLSRASCES